MNAAAMKMPNVARVLADAEDVEPSHSPNDTQNKCAFSASSKRKEGCVVRHCTNRRDAGGEDVVHQNGHDGHE